MLTPAEAQAEVARHLPCLAIESLPVAQCAGAVLRENVYAERDQPPFDRSMLDGIALSSAAAAAGRRQFKIQGTQAAGVAPFTLIDSNHCIEIMTGAALPVGCDAVVAIEKLRMVSGMAELATDQAVSSGQNIHPRGSDKLQGDLLLQTGQYLEAPEIAVAAGAGMARLRVSRQPGFMVVSTGDELVEPGEPIEGWQIRRSNAYGLCAALKRRGFARVSDDHLPDELDALQAQLKLHLSSYDVLILSGGVSMGKFDLVPRALAACGVRQVFHRVSQRPGKPLWFGVTADGKAVFALPGNPVSSLVCLARYVIPAMDQAMGATLSREEKIALAEIVDHAVPLTGFLPVRVIIDDWGRPWAVPVTPNTSGDFASLAGTTGFVELPAGPNTYAKGFVTRLYRW